jgi:sugar lactone lactonase YvrE
VLWVAGATTGVIRAQNARTGKVIASYSFGKGRFLNDLTVTRRAVYATDSFSSELAVIPLPRSGRVPPAGRARTLTLSGDFKPVANQFNLNGIVHRRGWLLAVQSVNGQLFRINPGTGRTTRVAVTKARLLNGDGLELRGDTLYVVRNMNNRVVALDLNRRLTAAAGLAVLTHRSLDVPATAAVAQGALWAVNARFEITKPTKRTPYWITRLPLAR